MIKSVGNDEWKERAAKLPSGSKRRAFHSCQTSFNKTSFEYGRNGTEVWCKCYRCGYSRREDLSHVVYRPTEFKQVKVPTDLTPVTESIAKHAQQMLGVLQAYNLLPYLSQLQASESYGRLYLPDDTGSYCGLDFTGKQFIPWRSPHKHNMAMKVSPRGEAETHRLWIYGDADAYLQQVRDGGHCAFVPVADDATVQALLSVALACEYNAVVISHHPNAARLRKELSILGKVHLTGD